MIGFLVFGLCKIGICECPDRCIVGMHRGECAMRGWGRNMRLLSAHKGVLCCICHSLFSFSEFQE